MENIQEVRPETLKALRALLPTRESLLKFTPPFALEIAYLLCFMERPTRKYNRKPKPKDHNRELTKIAKLEALRRHDEQQLAWGCPERFVVPRLFQSGLEAQEEYHKDHIRIAGEKIEALRGRAIQRWQRREKDGIPKLGRVSFK